MLKVLSFNILAPRAADPDDHDPVNEPWLNIEHRRKKILSVLNADYDIIGLQEVTHDTVVHCRGASYSKAGEYGHLTSLLEDNYHCGYVDHDVSYCAEWQRYDPSSPYYYISNGNALFLKRTTFSEVQFFNLPLGGGNHAIGAQVWYNGRRLYVVNLHLDSDSDDARSTEFTAALSALQTADNVLILGDHNAGTDIDPLHSIRTYYGYADAFGSRAVPTYPLTRKLSKRRPVDHILYRGPALRVQSTQTLGAKIWHHYPYQEDDAVQHFRLNAVLSQFGSDHLPITASFTVI